MHLVKTHPTIRSHVGLVQQNVINAYPVGDDEMGWRTGGLVMHFAGCWVTHRCQELWTENWARKLEI
jgi:hypothetical protein